MNKSTGVWSMVLVPAVISLAVTILRLVGELQGWNDQFFSNVAPGGDGKPGWVGIGWLMPIFGFWFGRKLRLQTGGPASLGKAALRFLIGAAVLIGGFAACIGLGLMVMPSEQAPGQPSGLLYALALALGSAIIMFTAWPRLAATLLLYGILARIPVIVITWLAVENAWGSHHTKLAPGTVLVAEGDRLMYLLMPQMTIWIVATIMVGGLFGCLGAKLTKSKS
ncbi:MAG: hypothetical protein ACI85K_001950 [Hyphomicrobiaceae bacterium]|jgi:hypothetical protein